VTAWFKAESFAVTDMRLISKSTGAQSSDHDFMLSTIAADDEIRLRLRLRAGGTTRTLIGSTAVQAGEWTHVALTYDGATLRLYQDGSVVGSINVIGAVGDEAPGTRIGQNPDGYAPFHGAIDDVRIYAAGLDADQVLNVMVGCDPDCLVPLCGDYFVDEAAGEECEPFDDSACPGQCVACQCIVPPPSDLLAHWPFDEGSGAEANDQSGNGHHGAISGASWTPGRRGSALHFDGVDDHLDVSSLSSASPELSVTAWFKAESFAVVDMRLISKSTGTQPRDHDFMVSTINVGGERRLRLRLRSDGTTRTLIGSRALQTGEWIHVALTYDGATLKLYHDGSVVGSMAMTGAVNDEAPDTWIGQNPDGYAPFHGAIDDVRIYGVGLDAARVLEVMASE
jgi:hypothetical protein